MAATIDTRFTTVGERRVVTKLVNDALAAGYTVSVSDGEEVVVKQSNNRAEILKAMASTGEDILVFRRADGTRVGSVLLIWNNAEDGSEVIADHSDNKDTRSLVKGAEELAERYAK